MFDLPTSGSPRVAAMIRQSFVAMTHQERTRVIAMFGVIAGLHVLGFFVLFAFVVPSHYKGLGIGVSILAYTLGLRHAFDADHISAIDNTIRKLLSERQDTRQPRPFGLGFFFSLGHSTVVVAIGIGIVVAEKTVFHAVANSGSGLEQFGGVFGTVVSASFLFLIGVLNLFILAGIARVFRSMRRGEYDEAELERQLENRGFFYRIFGRWMKAITREWQLYPVGVVFGLGFDTATEVALLATTALLASQHIPWYAILCLPIFIHGRYDTHGHHRRTIHEPGLRLGVLQSGPQGVLQPGHHRTVRGHLLLHRRGRGPRSVPPRDRGALAKATASARFMANFDINTAGFVIVGMFILTWLAALIVWRYGQIEKKWTARLQPASAGGMIAVPVADDGGTRPDRSG